MVGSFDGPIAGAVTFDDSGVGAVSSFSERELRDGFDDPLVRVAFIERGESPRSPRLRGG